MSYFFVGQSIGGSGVVQLSQLASGGASTGDVIQWNGSAWVPSSFVPGSGTVTSVGLTAPSALFAQPTSGSPITTSGTLALALVSQAANLVFRSGSGGTPTFSALATADIPTTLAATSFTGAISFASGTVMNGEGNGGLNITNSTNTFANAIELSFGPLTGNKSAIALDTSIKDSSGNTVNGFTFANNSANVYAPLLANTYYSLATGGPVFAYGNVLGYGLGFTTTPATVLYAGGVAVWSAISTAITLGVASTGPSFSTNANGSAASPAFNVNGQAGVYAASGQLLFSVGSSFVGGITNSSLGIVTMGAGIVSGNGSAGANNTGLGASASVGGATTTGATAIGHGALAAGNSSTALGNGASVGGFNNSTAIGYSATCTAANQIMLGTSAEATVIPGTTAWKAVVLSNPTALTTIQSASLSVFTGTTNSVSLPTGSSGTFYDFNNTGTGLLTVTSGTANITGIGLTAAASRTLSAGGTMRLAYNGTNWYVMSATGTVA